MSQADNLSAIALKKEIVERPLAFIKSHYSKLPQDQLKNAINGGDIVPVIERELGVEGLDQFDVEGLPCLNDCKTSEEVAQLHHKLVKFDCMVQDQYEDEFYVSYFNAKKPQDQQTQPPPSVGNEGLVFKYFSELSENEIQNFECQPQMDVAQQNMSERGNLLGVSVPNVNKWAAQGSQISAIVKLYDKNMNKFKLNDQVTFVGVLEFKEQDQQIPMGQEEQPESDGFFSGIPNEDKVPKLHAICSRKDCFLSSKNLQEKCGIQGIKDIDFETSQIFNSYEKIISIFRNIFHGDKTAAKYLLLNLVSRVTQRTPEGMALGHFNINIDGATSEQAKTVQELLKHILLCTINFDITTTSMSQARFQPKKNFDTNAMEAGMMQMLDGTSLIIDETKLESGKFENNGVHNIKALAELIEDQKVTYDFQYTQQSMPVSASVCIFSEMRSMFKNAIQVPLDKTKYDDYVMSPEKLQEILSDEDLMKQLRKYFMLLTHLQEKTVDDFTLSEDSSEYAQNYFIQKRQETLLSTDTKVDQHTFHQWLVMSRLICIAQGKLEMSVDHFKEVIEMEDTRKKRINGNKFISI